MLTVKTKTQFARSSLCSKVETVWKVAYCFTYTRARTPRAKTALKTAADTLRSGLQRTHP